MHEPETLKDFASFSNNKTQNCDLHLSTLKKKNPNNHAALFILIVVYFY